jgi:hypothetical protein
MDNQGIEDLINVAGPGCGTWPPSGYGYYRTSARTARRKIYYYRCILDRLATVNALRK